MKRKLKSQPKTKKIPDAKPSFFKKHKKPIIWLTVIASLAIIIANWLPITFFFINACENYYKPSQEAEIAEMLANPMLSENLFEMKRDTKAPLTKPTASPCPTLFPSKRNHNPEVIAKYIVPSDIDPKEMVEKLRKFAIEENGFTPSSYGDTGLSKSNPSTKYKNLKNLNLLIYQIEENHAIGVILTGSAAWE